MRVLWLLVRVVFRLLRWAAWLLAFLLKHGFRQGRKAIRARPTSHGSARWADLYDLVRGGALGGSKGLIVGKAYGQFIRFKGDGAVLCVAPQGKGKGVGVVVPNLLDHKGSVIVTDPKGENFAVTQRHRSTLGPVWRLDAIHPEESDFFNPLSMIRKGTFHEDTDTAQLASFLVIPESREGHWDTSAKNVLTAVIRHVLHAYPEEQQTLSLVRELIAAEGETLRGLFEEMAGSRIPSIAEQARITLNGLEHPETQSVLNNTAKGMAFWSKDRVGGWITQASDFRMEDLSREGMSVYLMVPDDKIDIFTPFLRVMMGCAVAALMRSKDRPPPAHKPMLLIDEAKALGRLDILATGMGMLRAYCQTVIIFQDLGQLRALYGQETATTFIAGSGAQVMFGVSDTRTAREVAEGIGRQTVMSSSYGTAAGNLSLVWAQHQDGRSETGRDLLDAAEVRFMNPNQCIIMMPDQVGAPIRGTKVRYYKEWRWRGLYDAWRQAEGVVVTLPTSNWFGDDDNMPDAPTTAGPGYARAGGSRARSR